MTSKVSLVDIGLSLMMGTGGLRGAGLSLSPSSLTLLNDGLSLEGESSPPPPLNPMLDLTNPDNVIYQLLVWGF